MTAYNVMTNPVIPVIMMNGVRQILCLRDALLHAHEIKCVDAQPLEKYAMERFLIAFLMDMLHPETVYDRRNLYVSGKISEAVFNDYIAMCEKDFPCFDLFDKTHPFMQAAYDTEMDEKSIKPVSSLRIDLPTGNNHMFLDHRRADSHSMTPSEAFMEMLTLYSFCTACAHGYPSCVNNTPPVYSVVEGDNLYKTLILNMVSQLECGQMDYGMGTVPWRKNNIIIPKQSVAEVTLLEGLTWQPRRITLLRDEDGMIRNISMQQGLDFKGNDLWKDPHVAYVFTAKNIWVSIKPRLGRSLWRDVGTLLADATKEKYRPPLNVTQAPIVLDNDSLILMIRQAGVATSNSAYLSVNYDSLSIPDCFMDCYSIAELLRRDLDLVETIQSQIASEINRRLNHTKDKQNVVNVAEQARQHFLVQAHSAVFNEFIPDLLNIKTVINEENIEKHKHIVQDAVKSAIINTVKDVVNKAGTDSESLLLQAEIKSAIMRSFTKKIKEGEKDNE